MEARSILAIVIAAIAAISPATSQSRQPITYSLHNKCKGVYEKLVDGEIAQKCRISFPTDQGRFHQCSQNFCAFLKCDDVPKCAIANQLAIPAVTYACSQKYGLDFTQHDPCCSQGCS